LSIDKKSEGEKCLLTSSTLPSPANGKDTASHEVDEKTEQQYDGIKFTINKTLQILSKLKNRFNNCSDLRYPSIVITSEPIKKALLDIKNRGIKSRVITEITKDNLHYCKELMEVISELRHIDDAKGNFAVTDTEYVSYAISSEKPISSMNGKVVVVFKSTSKEFVEQQQYIFDMLWNKAVPAERKIMEIELGIMLPDRTEIITGADNIHRLTLASASHIRESLDTSIDSIAPESIVAESMWNYMKELVSTKKGVRFRYIAEITKDNLPYCKQMAKIFELRHLDGIKGNLSIIDGREYRASPSVRPGAPPDVLIRSTAKVFVEQQQFVFETLWNKAIPARQRFKELEKGVKTEFVETVRDAKEIQQLSFNLIKNAEEEIEILFSMTNASRLQAKTEALKLLQEAALSRHVKIRILVPINDNNDKPIMTSGTMNQLRQSGIDILEIKKEAQLYPMQNKLTLLIADKSLCLTTELDEDSEEPLGEEKIGLATYSNSEPTIFAYSSIFENLWIHAIIPND
jgi:two-component system, OmpR family, sensor histidine kinase VicK